MASWTFYAFVVVCAAGFGYGNTIQNSSLTTTQLQSSSHVYFYMDDSDKCSGHTSYFSSLQQDAYVEAWGNSYPHTPPSEGCTAKFVSFYNSQMMFSFSTGDYISDWGVTLEIYDGSDSYGTPMVSGKYRMP